MWVMIMKQLSVNNDDKYLIDEGIEKRKIAKSKAIKRTLRKNKNELYSIAIICGCLVISLRSLKEVKGMVVGLFDQIKYAKMSTTKSDNDKEIENIIDNGYVSVLNIPSSFENRFYFEDKYLYDEDGNKVFLDGYTSPVYFMSCDLNPEILKNVHLRESKTKELGLNYSCVTNESIKHLPESVEELGLSYCFYLTDLNDLPEYCPNIKILHLDSLISLKDYSFLARLDNLEEVSIADSPFITQDIIDLLDEKGVKHNLTIQDIKNNLITSQIVNEIIKPDMTEREKIQAVCKYVIDTVTYDIYQSGDSNRHPLGCVLEDDKGVCISYAYLTNVLLEKANINTYLVTDDDHAWNMVNIDGKYYNIDTTSMDSLLMDKFLLDMFNVGVFYMADPEALTLSSTSKVESDEVKIPIELLEDVLRGQEEKDIFEKYGETFGCLLIYLSYMVKGAFMWCSPGFIMKIKGKVKRINRDYHRYYNEERLKNL